MADVQATLELDATRALSTVAEIERRLNAATTSTFDLDTGSAARDLDRVADEAKDVDESLGRAEKSALTFGQAIKGALAVVGARELVQGVVAVVNAASDLEESSSKAATVFGESFGQIQTFAEDAATAVGLSEEAAFAATGTFGNLFRAQGLAEQASADLSTGVVQLAADLASFNNLTVDETIEKLRAGLIGEVEPVRTLGINFTAASVEAKALELGLVGVGEELTDGAKLQARYAIFLEQTALASGDFARTSDGLANQTRILSAELQNLAVDIGRELLPVALELVDAAREDLIPALQDVGPALASIGAAGGRTAISLFSALLPLIEALTPILEVMATVLNSIPTPLLTVAASTTAVVRGFSAAAGAAEKLTGTSGRLAGALVGPAGVAAAFYLAAAAAVSFQDDVREALDLRDVADDANALATELLFLDKVTGPQIAEGFGDGLTKLGDQIDRITAPGAGDRFGDVLNEITTFGQANGSIKLQDAAANIAALDEAFAILAREQGVDTAGRLLTEFTEAAGLTDEQVARLLTIMPQFSSEMDTYGRTMLGAGDATADTADSIGEVETAAERAAREVDSLRQALDELIGTAVSVDEAAIAVQEAFDDFHETVHDNQEGVAALGDNLFDFSNVVAREVVGSFADAAQQIADNASTMLDAGFAADEVTQKTFDLIEQLKEEARAADLTEDQIARLIERYNLVPEKITTELETRYTTTGTPTQRVGIGSDAPRFQAEGGIWLGRPGGVGLQVAESGDEIVVPIDRPARAFDLLTAAGLVQQVDLSQAVAGGDGAVQPLIGSLSLTEYGGGGRRRAREIVDDVRDRVFLGTGKWLGGGNL